MRDAVDGSFWVVIVEFALHLEIPGGAHPLTCGLIFNFRENAY